ncbi:MAG: MaoC family dehydratase [Candidatus Omnitrophota bacterium]|nr:MaoC family dehydratase [Candidatus Omnitrophota bacterium]
MEKVSALKIEDFKEGKSYSFEKTVTAADIDVFAAITGDISPLHMSDEFARARGFKGRVAHGVLLAGFVSKIIGVDFPGENCLLQTMSLKFSTPCYAGDTLRITASVSQVSTAAGAVVLDIVIENAADRVTVAKGKAQVGFTKTTGK